MRRDKKEEEEGRFAMYQNLERSTVLQECRMFHETPPLKVRRCLEVLTKVLAVINQGEHLGRKEATEAFFAMTKLFQNKDASVRRMLYLVIKDMSEIADDVIIVTSSLMKDMTGKEDAFRGPAIRALCRITDGSLVQSIERYMKQAIVDKQPAVSSAALVSSLHLIRSCPDAVRRWANEVQEAANSDNSMVQFHALGLLYHIRQGDRLAVTKLVQKLSKQPLRSPHAACLLVRAATRLLAAEPPGSDSPLFDFLESCLRHKSEAVVYEAARAIVSLEHTTAKELAPAVSVLQIFCSSPKATLRFAAVRTLNLVAMKHPGAVTACNLDLEQLITDSNRSIATLAITTLLKTGSEASVDRLMKQISTFISDINDEFKIVVVQSIHALCSKYPRKHSVMMTFLSQMLRDEGSFAYKCSIVDTIISIIEENAEAKEAGLGHLCEFIEDCEHPSLAVRILTLLGHEGPKTLKPSKYIRFIYNRVILEVPSVRAAAVCALAKFGASQNDLLPSVLVLLERCKLDSDDEVRDRATLYHYLLTLKNDKLNATFVLDHMQCSVVGLEQSLLRYTQSPAKEPFDIKSVPLQAAPVRAPPEAELTARPTAAAVETKEDVYARQIAALPELSALGCLFKSSQVLRLTEEETEYSVQCVKHVFASGYVLLQFDLLNTLNDQLLESVHVQVECTDGDWEQVKVIPCPSLPYNQSGVCYVVLQAADPHAVYGSFSCTLKFLVKDCDPGTGEADGEEGYEDEYQLEELEVSLPDFVRGAGRANFSAAWEELSPDSQLEETFALSTVPSIPEAVQQLMKALGLAACDRGDKVEAGKSTHTLLLAGLFRGGHDLLVRARMAASGSGVTLNLTVRSSDPELSDLIVSAVG